MNFYYWLISQNQRPDAVGDLARDAMLDKDWPKDRLTDTPKQTYRRCRQYLSFMVGDTVPAMIALEQAVKEHQSYTEVLLLV